MSVRDAAIRFEARKIGLVQNKDGLVVKLVVHPDEVPEELVRSWVGSRYMVAMVEIGENEQPVVREKKTHPAVVAAGRLCRDPEFWMFLSRKTGVPPPRSEDDARNLLCFYLEINSRSELAHNEDAARAMLELADLFEAKRRRE